MSAVKSNLVKLIASNGCPNLKALEKTEEIESDLWKASEEDVVTEKMEDMTLFSQYHSWSF